MLYDAVEEEIERTVKKRGEILRDFESRADSLKERFKGRDLSMLVERGYLRSFGYFISDHDYVVYLSKKIDNGVIISTEI